MWLLYFVKCLTDFFFLVWDFVFLLYLLHYKYRCFILDFSETEDVKMIELFQHFAVS